MIPFQSIEEVLTFAIAREEEAEHFYIEQAGKAKRPDMRLTFEEFAKEERGHKAKLEAIRSGKYLMPTPQKVADLKIADYQAPVKPGPDMSYGDMLLLAMLREKEAFKLYSDLEAATPDENLRKTFAALAQEEAKHKLRFELEYDREVLSEN